ncbi:endospore germination permease [Clostridiaceae bacterium M8S5]|nr:endospore germination permease [Clostridiaceae bacterium M8S5]
MGKNYLSDSHATRMLILFFLGSSLAYNNALSAGQDNWLSIVIATFLALPLFYMYSFMKIKINARHIYDINRYTFGKYLGTFFNIFFIISGLFLSAAINRSYGEYLITISMPQTPIIVPLIIMALLAAWGARSGIVALSKWGNFFFFVNAPLPTIVFIFIIPFINIDNILPIMYNGITPVIKGSLYSLALPFAEILMFFTITFQLQSNKSYYKIFTKSILVSGLTLAGVTLLQILVMGFNLYDISFFPTHALASKISIGAFIERVEITMLIATSTAGYVQICIGLLGATVGICDLFKLNGHEVIVMPCCLLMINVSYFLYDNLIDLVDMYVNYWKYYIYFICLVIPFASFIILLFKTKILKKTNI